MIWHFIILIVSRKQHQEGKWKHLRFWTLLNVCWKYALNIPHSLFKVKCDADDGSSSARSWRVRQEGPQSLNTQTGDTVVMMMVRGYRIQYHAMSRQSERETLVCGGNIKTLTRRDKEDSDIEIQTKKRRWETQNSGIYQIKMEFLLYFYCGARFWDENVQILLTFWIKMDNTTILFVDFEWCGIRRWVACFVEKMTKNIPKFYSGSVFYEYLTLCWPTKEHPRAGQMGAQLWKTLFTERLRPCR